MRDKLITLTAIVLFGLLLAWSAPKINAWAAAEGSDVIECEAGAQVIQLAEGRIRVIGECVGVERSRANEDDKVYEYPYPVPENVYPSPEDTGCDVSWIWGEECNP